MAKKITQIEINGETYNINGGGGGSAGDALKQVSNMATYTPTDGEIVQYIGATTADYVHAGIYEYGVNMKTFAVGANKSGIPQGIYRTKASPTAMNLYVSGFNGSDGNTYHSAYYSKLRVGDVMWNISTAESFYITAVNSETSYKLENGVTATFSGSTHGGSIQVYEIDGYYFFDYSVSSIFTRAGYDVRSGFLMVGDVGEEFNNFTSTVFSGWFQLNQIGEGDVTVKKHGATVQTFNVNQQGNTNVELPNDVEMVHFNSGKAFYEAVTVCTEQNGLIYDPQELIDNPSDPRPLFPESDVYYYAANTDKVYAGETGDSDFVNVTKSVKLQNDTHKIYVDVDNNQQYRYNGSNFVQLSDLNAQINALSIGNSDPQDDDYIIAQYAGGGTTTTTYHRRPLSKFWNWIKSKLGIGTNDGTFLRKDGTWAIPTSTIYLGVATGNSLIAFIKTKISNGYKVGFLTAHGSSVDGCPDSTNVWIIQYQCDTSMGHAIQLMSWCYGSAWAIHKGYAWNNNNNEPSWKAVAYADDYVAKAGDTMSGNLTTPALKISGGRVQGSGDDEGLVIAPCSNSYAALTLAAGGDPQTASGKYHSTFYLQATGSYNMFWRASVNGTTYDIQHPKKSGTIALTSDIQQNTWRPLGTGASDACAGNDSRLSNSRPASDVYAWAKSASLAAAMNGTITTGSVTSCTGGTCSINWLQIGDIVIFTGWIKPSSSYTTSGSLSAGVPGTYKRQELFCGIQTNKSAVLRLIASGYIQNEGPVSSGESYYFQVVGIKVV